jgi:hypothetical protein
MAEEQLITALNRLFWKLPSFPGDDSDENGEWWAAELQDGDIFVIWNRETHEFVSELSPDDKKLPYSKLMIKIAKANGNRLDTVYAQVEIARLLNCEEHNARSNIFANMNTLIKKGIFKKVSRGIYYLTT